MSDAPENRQFVRCMIGENAKQSYTYHHDEEPPLEIGDWVDCETKHGTVKAKVVGLVEEAPKFPTRPARRSPPKAAPAEASVDG